jgi:hypothetical protein
MAAHNGQLSSIRDELQALGSGVPDVDLGSYSNGYGLSIGNVEVRRERLQSNIASMVKDVLHTHVQRGEISLDRPQD